MSDKELRKAVRDGDITRARELVTSNVVNKRRTRVHVTLYENFDIDQPFVIEADNLAMVLQGIEAWIRKHHDQCDGLCVGTPEMNWYHVLHFIEGEKYASLQWELESYYQGELQETEVGTFAEMCEIFIEKCRDFWLVRQMNQESVV